jgi:hypothetical protein
MNMTNAVSHISPINYNAMANIATGYYTGDASGAIPVDIGFTPTWVKVVDMSATTSPTSYEWILGMAATDSLIETQVAPQPVIDTNTNISTNGVINTGIVSAGVYLPSGSGAGDGTLSNTSVSDYSITQSGNRLTFGTNLNTTSHSYVWVAVG